MAEPTQTPEQQAETAAAQYEVEEAGPAAATPAETPPAPQAPEPAKPRHPAWLTKMAADLGVEQEDVDSSTQAELERLVRYQARQAKAEANDLRREKAQQRPQEAPEPEPDLWGKDSDGKPYAEQDYLPGIASAIKEVHSLRKEVKELRSALEGLGHSERRREAETAAERIDRFFVELGSEYKEVFGEANRADIDTGSPEFKRRMAVINSLGDMPVSHPQFKSKMHQAAKEIFGDRVKPPASPPAAPAAEAYTPEQKRWVNGGVSKPTHREGSAEPKGPKKAEKAVAALLKEMGGEQPVDMDEFLE